MWRYFVCHPEKTQWHPHHSPGHWDTLFLYPGTWPRVSACDPLFPILLTSHASDPNVQYWSNITAPLHWEWSRLSQAQNTTPNKTQSLTLHWIRDTGRSRERKGSVEWRYGGWLVRTRFICPVARGYTHSKLSFPLLHSPIKISCSTFIAEISWQFIIFTIVNDIYLHFTSILLNIYHFNGQW